MVPSSLIRRGEVRRRREWGKKNLTPQTEAASNEIVLLVQSSISTQIHIEGSRTTQRTRCHRRADFYPLNRRRESVHPSYFVTGNK